MMKILLQKSMERVTLHITLRYQRKRLVDRMRLTKIMKLWGRTLTMMNQRLLMPCMFSSQLNNLQSMRLLNLVCWIVTKNNGKVSAICAQFTIENLMNNISRKWVMCPYVSIVDANSVSQRSKLTMSANYSHLQIALWFNDPASSFWVDEVSRTFVWNNGIIFNFSFV